eukprot:6192409-Pleurochrysis_carterae.AAC.4
MNDHARHRNPCMKGRTVPILDTATESRRRAGGLARGQRAHLEVVVVADHAAALPRQRVLRVEARVVRIPARPPARLRAGAKAGRHVAGAENCPARQGHGHVGSVVEIRLGCRDSTAGHEGNRFEQRERLVEQELKGRESYN